MKELYAGIRLRIRASMAELNLSLSDLAQNIGMHSNTIRYFLADDGKGLHLSTAVKLAAALNLSLDELVFGKATDKT
jgi:DNA-binding Xre family transcriptional regulator